MDKVSPDNVNEEILNVSYGGLYARTSVRDLNDNNQETLSYTVCEKFHLACSSICLRLQFSNNRCQ
jgi:hypothetical protein